MSLLITSISPGTSSALEIAISLPSLKTLTSVGFGANLHVYFKLFHLESTLAASLKIKKAILNNEYVANESIAYKTEVKT